MKKTYQKPEIELISLLVPERIAFGEEIDNEEDLFDGEMGIESSVFQ